MAPRRRCLLRAALKPVSLPARLTEEKTDYPAPQKPLVYRYGILTLPLELLPLI
jgi:hypothetical protein